MNEVIIKEYILKEYGIKINKIKLLRDVIGSVYLLEDPKLKFILKIYKKDTSIEVEKVVDVMNYIYQNNGPVPKIYLNKHHRQVSKFQDQSVVLFEYIEGIDVNPFKNQKEIIEAYENIQRIMKSYPKELPKTGKDYYINRYLRTLESIGYDPGKISSLKKMADSLFDATLKLSTGFTHGDYHTGNMILKQEKLIVFDFDACTSYSSLLDLVTCFDQTNFNKLAISDIAKTKVFLDKELHINIDEIDNCLAFIPIRHMEIISNILEAQGKSLSIDFYNQQYDWILEYCNYIKS